MRGSKSLKFLINHQNKYRQGVYKNATGLYKININSTQAYKDVTVNPTIVNSQVKLKVPSM
jgi:hypothetical protein